MSDHREHNPHKVSAGQPNDDEDMQQIEANGGTTNRSMAAMSDAWLRRKVPLFASPFKSKGRLEASRSTWSSVVEF
jgi:hypothetical protein